MGHTDKDTPHSERYLKEVIVGITKTLWNKVDTITDSEEERNEILSRPKPKQEAKQIRSKLLKIIFESKPEPTITYKGK